MAKPYSYLSVHLIDDKLLFKMCCLQTAYFRADHTGENIADGLRVFE